MDSIQGRVLGEISTRPVRWSSIDILAAFLVIVGIVVTSLWFAFPSSSFIREISTTLEGKRVIFVRELPYGETTARWWSEITLIDADGFECASGAPQTSFYQQAPGNTATWDLGDWAMSCLDEGPPFYLTAHRQVMLFGIIPLRPMRSTTEVQGIRPSTVVNIPTEE